jgi:hypothetical protein
MGWCGSKLENVEYPSRQVSLGIAGRVVCKLFIRSTSSQVQTYFSNLLRKEQAKRFITKMPRTLRKCLSVLL